jgi:hypothetical protein
MTMPRTMLDWQGQPRPASGPVRDGGGSIRCSDSRHSPDRRTATSFSLGPTLGERNSKMTDQHEEWQRRLRNDLPAGLSRRIFMASGAATAGVAAAPPPAAAESGPALAGASGAMPLEVESPMARWKLPQPLEFVNGATERFSFPNWQSSNADSVY